MKLGPMVRRAVKKLISSGTVVLSEKDKEWRNQSFVWDEHRNLFLRDIGDRVGK